MTQAPQLIPVDNGSPYLGTVAQWIADEWSEESGDSVETIKQKILNSDHAPPSHVAVIEDLPVGLVWLCRYQAQDESQPSLWINALYVQEAFRNRGIATELVTRAMHISSAFEDRLYAYTDIPEFYLRLGWSVHKEANEEGHSVVVHVN